MGLAPAKEPFGLLLPVYHKEGVKQLPVYHTWWRLHTVSFTADRQAVNTNFYGFRFDLTGNRTHVHCFSSRHSIHSTTDRYKWNIINQDFTIRIISLAATNLIFEKAVIKLKGHSGRKFFWLIFSRKTLTNLKTNFTKFELSTTFRSQDIII